MPTLIKNMAEQLKQEHQIIRVAAKKLKDLVERPASSNEAEQAIWLKSVHELLVSLSSHLKAHFAFEEFGGFMEEVVAMSPNDSPQVVRLHQDHQTIQAEGESLCALAAKTSTRTPQLKRRILRFLEELDRHEHAENGLVQRVLTGDLGTTD